MEDLERIKERLGNLQSVEPILTSLRTISASGWRLALRRLRNVERYAEHLRDTLAALLDHVPPSALERGFFETKPTIPHTVAMIVIASERGLCGAFNDVTLSGAERWIARQRTQSERVWVVTLGSRAEAYFRTREEVLAAYPLPITRVASASSIRDVGEELITLLRNRELDAIEVVYSPYRATSILPPVVERWLPMPVAALPQVEDAFPLPIVETSPLELFERALRDWHHARLYRCVMQAAASEQAARFRAMEAASTNLQRLIDELTLNYHTARQHAITMEMLDLVAGSGILWTPQGPEPLKE